MADIAGDRLRDREPSGLPTHQQLRPLLEACCRSIEDSLRALTSRKVEITPGTLAATTPRALAARLGAQVAVVRGALDGDFAGKTLRFLCQAPDATTLAGCMLASPLPLITARRNTGLLQGEELEAFAEVANVLCSSIDAVLRAKLGGKVGLQAQDHATLAPQAADCSVLGDAPCIELALQLAIDAYPASSASILIDPSTAERWNGGPLKIAPGGFVLSVANRGAGVLDTNADDGPAAPIRGRLAAFLAESDATTMLRRTCRRIGLDLDKRPRGDVPNPAANKDAIVLIEVTPNEERRFEWCRRIKTFRPQTKVVLLLAVASRKHVLYAARAGADVVLGHPVSAQLLTQKLTALLQSAASAPADASRSAAR